MSQPARRGLDLLAEIELAHCPVPTLWWLGHSGFVLKYKSATLYVDPCQSDSQGPRLTAPLFAASDVRHAGLLLCTHAHDDHFDPPTARAILEASPKARLVIPKSAAQHAHAFGIPFHRMVTTDSGLRVEYLDDRIYAVPSAHDALDWTPLGGYPYLGYLIRFGNWTIYHAGDSVLYDGLANRLRPYNVTVALLPISGRTKTETTFDAAEAAQLAEDIGARWLIPMHYGVFPDNTTDVNRFIEHMLFHRPSQRFKVFECGERWPLPANEDEA
ncbi:MAG: MBL fold metallo-hydrolase [Bryobacteraceae bacterium]